MNPRVDFVIVGAGSAGCVLANRLSEDPSLQVVLLEAGGKDGSFLYRMPAGFFALMKAGIGNWNFDTVPQEHLDNRVLYFPRGKVLGGSSAINGLVVSRGNPGDYDRWAKMGNIGWSFADCLPYFKRIESYPAGDPALRGHCGPVGVTATPLEVMNPTTRAWIEGGVQAGHPFVKDVNTGNPYGMAQMQGNYANAVRQSAAACYLTPVLDRPNLKVITGATVKRVILEGNRAVGIEYLHRGGIEIIRANREVLLCGGVINTPQLLQLSGIGDPADIAPHGIRVQHELPGVGRNLRDHLAISVKQRLTKPYSLLSSLKPLAMVKSLAQYLLFKSGETAVGGLEGWAHLKSSPELEYPDLQCYAVPLMYNDHGRDVIKEEGFQVVLNAAQPNSVGTVKIRSNDPLAAPAIDPCFLSAPEDIGQLRSGIRQVREIFSQKAYDDFRGSEYAPGAEATSDAALDTYIRATANSIYHPVGTCKMGSDDMAVVDTTLKVRGIDGLRVVDASVMPHIISGNTNFPTMMIAEKAADMILGRPAL